MLIKVREICRIFRHRLIAGAGFLAAGQYIGATLNLGTNLLIARLLGPAGYGLVALTLAYPTLLWSFISVKSVSVITRYVAVYRAQKEHEKLKAVIGIGYAADFFLSLSVSLLVGATAWWVTGSLYGYPELTFPMIVYALTFPLTSLTGSSWSILLSWERFSLLSVFEVTHPLLKLILAGGLALIGFGVTGVVIGLGLAGAINGLLMVGAATGILVREGIGPWWKASLREAMPLRKELVSFFGWNYLSVTLSGILSQVPLMLLGRLRGPEEAGWFRLATNLVTISSYIRSSLGRVAYPVLASRWGAGGQDMMVTSVWHWTRKVGIPAGLLTFAAIPILPLLMPLLFGSAYDPAVPLAQIMFASAAVGLAFFWLNAFYYALGKIKVWTLSYGLYTFAVIGLSWVIIPMWGVMGLTGLMAASEALFTLTMMSLVYHLYPKRTELKYISQSSKLSDIR